ncbi:hypothetical protein V8C37DRAFT_365269 [Trichoderma ceciliae]
MSTPKPHHHHPHQPFKPSAKSLFLLQFLSLMTPSRANTEKVIFTAPSPVSLSDLAAFLPALDQNIPVLDPSARWSLRSNLTRVFPINQEEEEPGYPSWLLLDNLTPGRRYELRVCWSALEPTAFTLDTYPLTTVLSTPSLLQSLTQHGKSISSLDRQPQLDGEEHQPEPPHQHLAPSDDSVLLLRVLAAADYFSHHSSLMKDPPPVLVDLILDPYLYNVLPQSLVPTVCYLVIVGVVSWFVAQWVANSLTSIASSGGDDHTKKQN